MIQPDFLVIGAPRSGTTSLYAYLTEHPSIYMSPVKETRYFAYAGENVSYTGPADSRSINRNTITRRDEYEQLIGGAVDGQLRGEASPIYMYSETAANRIYAEVPDVKLIAILRDPTERAYSDFLNMVRLGWEPLDDFPQALLEEPRRIEAGWGPFYHYRSKGYYAQQLKRYLARFHRDQLRVYLYEDLRRSPMEMVQDIFAFLGVDEQVAPDVTARHNRSGLPRLEWVHRLVTSSLAETLMRGSVLRGLRTALRERNLRHDTPDMPAEARAYLQECFRADVTELEDLIDRDLSHWLGKTYA